MTYDVRAIDEELAACDLSFREQCRIVAEGVKKGFSYDGCTAVPDFNFGYDCCGEHDTYYQSQVVTRAEADRKLYECILNKGVPSKLGPIPYNTNWMLASVYYVGVRVAGWFFWNKRKKGNGNEKIYVADTDRDLSGPS